MHLRQALNHLLDWSALSLYQVDLEKCEKLCSLGVEVGNPQFFVKVFVIHQTFKHLEMNSCWFSIITYIDRLKLSRVAPNLS